LGTLIFRSRPPACRISSAVITLVMDAIGRTELAPFAHSTWPVVASTSMPALALTFAGAPTTSSTGPADTVLACGEAVSVPFADAAELAELAAIAEWLVVGRVAPAA
jgi:hypothetical protein